MKRGIKKGEFVHAKAFENIWGYTKNAGSICAMISDFPSEKIEMIKGWCEYILKNKENEMNEMQSERTQGDREMTFDEKCHYFRRELKRIEDAVRKLMEDKRFENEQTFGGQHAETKANIMLTVRHLEDARMRVGKVLQYAGDGVSILDK